MKLATIRVNDATTVARLDGDHLTVLPYEDLRSLLSSGSDWRERAEAATGAQVELDSASLAPLVTMPEKIFCVGLNYRDHAEESGQPVPDFPTLFAKFGRSLIGAHDDIHLPEVSKAVDWEVELGVLIGSTARNASPEQAGAAIAGYTVVNDVSMRDWQMRTPEWTQGKTFEDSTPVGPFLITPDEVDHARSLTIRCEVDGMVVQESNTNQLIFSPTDLVSYISEIITLVPGDLIATGTPGGIGAVQTPPVFLSPGQVLRSSIEGLGTLENRCV